MTRLVVASNRLPAIRSSGAPGGPKVPAGGLASAVLGSLQRYEGSLWFGWSGRIAEKGREQKLAKQSVLGIELVGAPLTNRELQEYYLGFCNQVLWPLFHSFQSSVKIEPAHVATYRSVQARFAALLLPLLKERDIVWVHDYHLLFFGRELRRLGWTGRLGFFLHIPFPPYDLWQLMPDPRDTLEAMLHYDVMGFHIDGYVDNYAYTCQRILGAHWDGRFLTACGRTQRVDSFPVGIEPKDFLPKGERRGVLQRVVRDRRLILGVDRLDYTKGIPERILAVEDFLKRYVEWHKKVIFIQIASPSRTEVPQYAEQRKLIESLMGRVNGEIGEHDWVPARYLYRTYSREFLASLYRDSDVGLVTPLRDGMNLVAKEFVAAQDPEAPGVLILSRCAGAAEELREAVIVNPFVPSDVADGIERALSMTREERRERHAALLARVEAHTAQDWGRQFVAELEGIARKRPAAAAKAGPARRPQQTLH
jgi:trehalose 6-phosphate synthase